MAFVREIPLPLVEKFLEIVAEKVEQSLLPQSQVAFVKLIKLTLMVRHFLLDSNRLLSNIDFIRLKIDGKRYRSEEFFLQAQTRLIHEESRLGVIASKRLGNAVTRNRLKRIIREIFRRNKHDFECSVDMIVIPRKGSLKVSFAFLEARFLSAVRQILSQT